MDTELFTGFVGLVVVVGGFMVGVVWLIFPFVVWSKLSELLIVQRAVLKQLEVLNSIQAKHAEAVNQWSAREDDLLQAIASGERVRAA